MRFLKVDWTSDTVIFLGGMFFLLMIVIGLLGRISPRSAKKRARLRRRLAKDGRDPWDDRDIII